MTKEKTITPDDSRILAWQAVSQLRTAWAEVPKIIAPPAVTPPTSFPDDYDTTNIEQICQYGDTLRLTALLTQGTDFLNDDDGTLEAAALNGHTEIVRILLDHGVDIHRNEDVAILLASNGDHVETVFLLAERGAPVQKLALAHFDAYNAYRKTREQMVANGYNLVEEKALAAEALTKIFNSQTWTGHTAEMLRLWSQVPEDLQPEFDFSHALSDVNIQTMKQTSRKAKITLTR